MQRRALGARDLADWNGSKEIGLALDRRGACALRQIHHRGDAAEIVGQRHDRAAVQNIRDGCEFVADGKFGLDALRRYVSKLDAEKRGERSLKIEIDPMITHTMPLSDINKAFDLMHQGKSIRSVVVY